jgi:hypothetical protein
LPFTYVHDKDELVDLILDRVIGETNLAAIPADLPWPEQVQAIGREMRRVFANHRDVARATPGRIPQGENALTLMNATLGPLREAAGAVSYEESMIATEVTGDPEFLDHFVAELRTYFERLPRDRFPSSSRWPAPSPQMPIASSSASTSSSAASPRDPPTLLSPTPELVSRPPAAASAAHSTRGRC